MSIPTGREAPVYPINTTENTSWPSQDENYVAVFEAPGDKTQELVDGGLLDIAVTVHPCAIYFASQGFDVEDNGTLDPNYEYLESEITPYYDPNNTGVCPQSMVIDVAANCSDTLVLSLRTHHSFGLTTRTSTRSLNTRSPFSALSVAG